MNKIQYEKANKKIAEFALRKPKSESEIEEADKLVKEVEAYEKQHPKRKQKNINKIL